MPDTSYFNPFQAMDVVVPGEFHQHVSRYSQRMGGKPDDSPFPRMVDFWFLALCVAAREGMQPRDLSGVVTRKIIEGTIFSNDQWRVQLLMLIAVARTGDIEVLNEPNRVFSLANGLAAAGMPRVVELLQDGPSEPIWNLSEGLLEMLPAD